MSWVPTFHIWIYPHFYCDIIKFIIIISKYRLTSVKPNAIAYRLYVILLLRSFMKSVCINSLPTIILWYWTPSKLYHNFVYKIAYSLNSIPSEYPDEQKNELALQYSFELTCKFWHLSLCNIIFIDILIYCTCGWNSDKLQLSNIKRKFGVQAVEAFRSKSS